MYDILPFPNITAGSVEEQTAQINNYLIQLKETLEFVLTNISVENLSQELLVKLNDIGVETNTEENLEQIQQVSRQLLTVSDVVNSNLLKEKLNNVLPKNYLVYVKQIESSDEPNGINIYAFKDNNGEITRLTIKNVETPKMAFNIDFDTGNLEYTVL